MFGKKDNDEYTNDYIRPSEEYRAECTDEHGMTYENHDDEQRPYDEYNSTESCFSGMLLSGEHILWTGKTAKGAGLRAKGGNALTAIFPLFWLGFACFWTLSASLMGGVFGLFGVPFILVGVYMLKRTFVIGEQKYAITDRRVLKYADKKFSAEMLDNITDITVYDAGNNIGYVRYFLKGYVYSGNNYGSRNMSTTVQHGFFGIANPNEAYRILSDAVYSFTTQN